MSGARMAKSMKKPIRELLKDKTKEVSRKITGKNKIRLIPETEIRRLKNEEGLKELARGMIASNVVHEIETLDGRKNKDVTPYQLQKVTKRLLVRQIDPNNIERILKEHGHQPDKIAKALEHHGYAEHDGKWAKYIKRITDEKGRDIYKS
jgi:hypothetical protein